MKLTVFFCFIVVFNVSATGYAQDVTIVRQKASLEQVIKELKKQTGYKLFYNNNMLSGISLYNLSLRKVPLEQALQQIFKGQPLTYSISEHTIIIKKKEGPALPSINRVLAAPIRLAGVVTDSTGMPLAGANIIVNAKQNGVSTDRDGKFVLDVDEGDQVSISFIGYLTQTLKVTRETGFLNIVLHQKSSLLKEVFVNTGYQELPRERATGSFVQVDRKLLERSVSTDIIDRLQNVVPGLAFNLIGTSRISIRGQSTLFSNAEPLIVVDNFPYNQPIENLNPNDVESISVLKDAAAASIWGARAGNGVIVITTKKGRLNTAPQISFSSNVTVGQRPDLQSVPHMSSADYVDIERRLFSEDYFTGIEQSDNHQPLSPVVELLIAGRDGLISTGEMESRIKALATQDVRKDKSAYLYRQSVKQQYALSLSGGSDLQRYFVSAGADRNMDNISGQGYDRLTLNANNSWSLVGKKLEISLGMNYTRSKLALNNASSLTWKGGYPIYPYAQLADEAGNPLPLIRDYREAFVKSAPGLGLLDWSYSPLADLGNSENHVSVSDMRVNTGLKYKLPLGLSAQVLYQYDRSQTSGRLTNEAGSYYTRNLINRYTQDDGSGTLSRPVPLGGIVDISEGTSVNHDLRGQLNYEKNFGRHAINAIAGYEIQTLNVLGDSYRLYGYDSEHATSKDVDLVTEFLFYDNPGQALPIPSNTGESDATDHYRSYYANAAYTYDGRLTLSASARKDQSNLFGVSTNQKGVPLYSIGASWDISKEAFYHAAFLPQLKLRASFGYNGNINKSLSAYTTANYIDGSNSSTRLPYAQIINPPNPELRWERVQHINLGVDFGAFSNRISGTVEFFFKKGLDLIGSSSLAPSSGITTFTGNNADTKGHGLDIALESRNLTGRFSWTTNFIFSYATDIVSVYDKPSVAEGYLDQGDRGGYALKGRPLYALYSYQSAGLDPATGAPRGYLNGKVSMDYVGMGTAATPENLVFHGSSRPLTFGALRNTFGYGALEFSFNISYKLGYYYRRPSVAYGNDHGLAQQSGDYALRWQKPGDEMHTIVQSMPASTDGQRDLFYRYSSGLVEKGDHVRLQDARLAYTFTKGNFAFLSTGSLQVYLYAANLGILWRANHSHTDPDAVGFYSMPRTIAGGLRLNF